MKTNNTLPEQIREKLEQEEAFHKNDKWLVAVSGGKDSMTLAHIIESMGLPYAVAHVNYGLRAEESDADAAFVKAYFEAKGIQVFLKKTDTKAYAGEHKKSIQEAAREIRYAWFYTLLNDFNFTWVATAHHAQDQLETFLHHLFRGTGIQGLTGIPFTRDHIIRPLIDTPLEELESYRLEHAIPFREDLSNSENTYIRNKIRNVILPVIAQEFPHGREGMLHTMRLLSSSARFHRQAVLRLRHDLIVYDPNTGYEKISMLELIGRQISATLLVELLGDYGISLTQAENMLDAIGKTGSQVFETPEIRILADRGFFVLVPKDSELEEDGELEITEAMALEGKAGPYRFEWHADNTEVQKDKAEAWMDASQIVWPMYRRKWKEGDKIQPLGMRGRKKLSDIFVDLKIGQVEKKSIPVWESGGRICWVEGLVISEEVAVKKDSAAVLRIYRAKG